MLLYASYIDAVQGPAGEIVSLISPGSGISNPTAIYVDNNGTMYIGGTDSSYSVNILSKALNTHKNSVAPIAGGGFSLSNGMTFTDADFGSFSWKLPAK